MFRSALLRRERPPLSRRVQQTERKQAGWGTLILWGVFVVVLSYSLFFSPWLVIHEVVWVGETVVPQALVEAALETELSGQRFYIFPRKHLLTLPARTIEEQLIQQFPKFASVKVERVAPGTLRVRLVEMPILIRWCSGGPCALLRPDGSTLPTETAETEYYAPITYTIVDKSAVPIAVGALLETEEYQVALNDIAQNFTRLTGKMLSRTTETPTKQAKELRLRVDDQWDWLISVERPASESLTLLQDLLERHIRQEKITQLISIDTRTEGRVFIGYRDFAGEEILVENAPQPENESKKKKKRQTDD